MVNMIRARALFVVALLIAAGTSAFCPPTTNKGRFSLHPARANNNQLSPLSIATTTTLAERRWNFNEGQSPWGMKENAEIWNGRVAQVRILEPHQYSCIPLYTYTPYKLRTRMFLTTTVIIPILTYADKYIRFSFFLSGFHPLFFSVADGLCLDIFAGTDYRKGCGTGHPRRRSRESGLRGRLRRDGRWFDRLVGHQGR